MLSWIHRVGYSMHYYSVLFLIESQSIIGCETSPRNISRGSVLYDS